MVRHPRDDARVERQMRMRAVRWIRISAVKRCLRRLGAGTAERRKAYRELFRTADDADFADALRAAPNGGWALGGARFKRQIAKALRSSRRSAAGLRRWRRVDRRGGSRIDGR